MSEARSQEITIVDRISVKEIRDRIEVEWRLSAKPDLEWAEVFQMTTPPERKGAVDWVMGGGPDVMDSVVRWLIPEAELGNADAEVKYRLAVANERLGLDRPVL